MGQYGSGISMQMAFAYDKERIKKAMEGELLCGEDENGFQYAPAGYEECREFILEAFDNAVYQALTANASGRALEKVAKDNGLDFNQHIAELLEAKEQEEKADWDRGEYRFEEGEGNGED